MSKHQQRVKMKALVIARKIIDFNILSMSSYQAGHVMSKHAELEAVKLTPTHLFRTDKPELDKRRYRRHMRKTGGYIVTAR